MIATAQFKSSPTDDGGSYGARTPYASGGGFSMPSIGSTFGSPAEPTGTSSAALNVPKLPTASAPTFSVPTHSGAAGATLIDVAPVLMPTASGTPSYSPGSGSGASTPAVVPSTSPDYFNQVLDLIAEQLQTGQPSATQQFSATPILLPSGGAYAGGGGGGGGGISLGDSAASGGAAGPKWGRLAVVIIAAGAAFYWFYWRKRRGAA